MIEKLIYVALQYPGEEIVESIISKFDEHDGSLNRWTWVIQIANLILLLYVLEKKLGSGRDLDELQKVIKDELIEGIEGPLVKSGELVTEAEECRYLASKNINPDSEISSSSLAGLMLEYRKPNLFHALNETVRNHALDSLPADYGMMTYLVYECMKQVSGHEPEDGEQRSLIAALEVLFEDFYQHIDGQVEEYFSLAD